MRHHKGLDEYTEDVCAERWKLCHFLQHHRVYQSKRIKNMYITQRHLSSHTYYAILLKIISYPSLHTLTTLLKGTRHLSWSPVVTK